jgi:hypothetical protein
MLGVIVGGTVFCMIIVLSPRGMGAFVHSLPLLFITVMYVFTFEKIKLSRNAEPEDGQVFSEGAPSEKLSS